MKKLFLMAAAVLFGMNVSAQKYVVWSGDELTADEQQLPVDWYGWWNMAYPTIDDETSAEGKSIFWHSENGTPPCSAGVYIGDNGHTFDMSKLAVMDLVFNAKRTDSGTWTLRLTGNASGDVDYSLSNIPGDGEWHEVRLNIKDCFPKIYETWMKAADDPAYCKGYVFALVGDGQNGTTGIYTSDIHYETMVSMPEIEINATDVTATSAKVAYSVTFPAGYTNTTVTLNGEEVALSGTVNLTDLEPRTEYTYTLVATGDLGGKTYSAEKILTFTTLRDLSDTPVWYGQFDGTTTQYGNTYNVHVDYNIAYNSDNTLTVYAEFNGTDGIVGLANHQLSFVRGLVEEWTFMTKEGDGWIYTTTGTVADGTEVEFFFWLPYAEGVFGGNYHQTYVAGSSNEAPVTAPRVKAEAKNVTYNSAEIEYTVNIPSSLADAEVKVYYKETEGEAIEATESPIVLTGLTEKTEYAYEVFAVATLAGETYISQSVAVNFKTPAQDAVDLVYADYTKSEFKNAYLVGEDASMARSMFVSLPWSVVLSTDGTARYEIDLAQVKNVVGLTPQIYWNGFKALTKEADSDVWFYDFGQQTAEETVAISHYIAYSGGVFDQRTPYTAWGQEQELPAIGDAAAFSLSASKEYVKISEPFLISAVVKDANGYYLAPEEVEYTLPAGLEMTNSVAKITGSKGNYVINAECGALNASVTVVAIASPESNELAHGIVGETGDTEFLNGDGFGPVNATDGNINTELRWDCTTTDNHYLTLDLGEDPFYIEAVDLLFEGAYATDFTVTLSNAKPYGAAPAPRREEAPDKVFTVTGGNTTHHVLTQDPDAAHRYVTLETTKALNSGWGIKVKEVAVYGTVDAPTTVGIENVKVEGAAAARVDVYNLMGVKVLSGVDAADAASRLAPGLYIIGGKKVLVK